MTGRRLSEVIEGLAVKPMRGAASCTATRLVEDSRAIEPGDLFLARSGGAVDGRRFICDAVAAGAVAVLSDEKGCEMTTGAALCMSNPRGVVGPIAHRLLGDPSAALPLIGVTGTNGKTTVSTLLQQVCRTTRPWGLLGGVVIDDGETSRPAALTTPMACDVAIWLAACRDHGLEGAVMEVSSHALAQGRVDGVRFQGAIFTNLSGDHLDYHGTVDQYEACKRQLFESLDASAWAVTNVDDVASRRMTGVCACPVIGCSLGGAAEVVGRVQSRDVTGSTARVDTPWGSWTQQIPLPGDHNVMNALQVIAAAGAMGRSPEEIEDRMQQSVGPPGRLQVIHQSPAVMVDFAHTDGALEAVLGAVRAVVSGRVLLVVGCGGDRDRTKRPRMAAAACRGADEIWLTSDNPRGERPSAIIQDMLEGATDQAIVHVEADRAVAIGSAIAAAAGDDLVLIAGKGHERVQIEGDEQRPFDDADVARRALGGTLG